MKTIKITLIIVVVSLIAFFSIRSCVTPPTIGQIKNSDNDAIRRIEEKIDSIKKLPDHTFAKTYFDEINFILTDYHARERLASNKWENDQQRDKFDQILYAEYTEKFIKQAFYVFRSSEWKPNDLKFIRSEYQLLLKSPWLEKEDFRNRFLTEIKTVFAKYDELNEFIDTCNKFSYLGSDLSDRFPKEEANILISRASTYRSNRLENEYVNKCVRLHDKLKEVPAKIFQAHVNYLDNKIQKHIGQYSHYPTQKLYNDSMYTIIKNEIDSLDNGLYNVPNYNAEFSRLISRWADEASDAYDFHNFR